MSLPYIDAKKPQDVALAQTTQENLEGSTKKYIAAAKLDCESHVMIGHPYNRDFKFMMRNNMIKNCSITTYDIMNSHTMVDQNVYGTRGKTLQQNTDRAVMNKVALPRDF